MPTVKATGTINNDSITKTNEIIDDKISKEHSPDGSDLLLDKNPHPLNGAEVAMIAVFRIAEALARALEGNHKFGELIAYDNLTFDAKLNINATSISTVGISNPVNANFEVAINIDTKIHPSLVELLRVEAGLGLWHRKGMQDGKFIHVQARPAQKVLEHIINMAKDIELGVRSGFQSGVNNANYQPDATKI